MISRVNILLVALLTLSVGAPGAEGIEGPGAAAQSRARGPEALEAYDAGGRAIDSLQAGSTLYVGARDLTPHHTFEFRLGVLGGADNAADAISFARIGADDVGNIAPFVLWYHSGVVGCSLRDPDAELGTFMFRTFEDAEEQLAGRKLIVTVHEVEDDRSGRRSPRELEVGGAVERLDLPVYRATSPFLYPSNERGCLLNSARVGERDTFVSGRNFEPGETVVLSVVANQRSWIVGDPVIDVTGPSGISEPEKAEVNEEGSFTTRIWERARQQRGIYDLIAQPDASEPVLMALRTVDIASYAADTGFVMFTPPPVPGAVPTTDIAGRWRSAIPYSWNTFQFSDSFAEGGFDTVWGAVDPTIVPPSHPGGNYAAYYVVPHRSTTGWHPIIGSTLLADVSGGIEIIPVKTGCINSSIVPIWNAPLLPGNYDVVVEFGSNPAETKPDYQTDLEYDAAIDFLDGGDRIGFVVAPDPWAEGEFKVGEASYNEVDYFLPTLGGAAAVDLRAVVRYPAVSAGVDTEVAEGKHPIFFIEHGHHIFCDVLELGGIDIDYWDAVWQFENDVITKAEFLDGKYTIATCPEDGRTRNHEGYMDLLNVLASHGIIAVSVDAYDLLEPEDDGQDFMWITARAMLILKHIELWAYINDTSSLPAHIDFFNERFKDHVEMSRISISGHSRGGEAAVVAYGLNSSAPTPHNIGSVASIAPIDSREKVLAGVPYFVIIPAADGQLADLPGIPIYDRANDAHNKSGIYIYGANHNFFNTEWAEDGDDAWEGRADEIQPEDQQRIGEAYLAAFARIHLKDETIYEDMLRGRLVFPSTEGFKIYHIRHEGEHKRFESGLGSPETDPGVKAESTSLPCSDATDPCFSSVHSTDALEVTWSQADTRMTFELTSAQNNASNYQFLSFRVARFVDVQPMSGDLDFTVELVREIPLFGEIVAATYVGSHDVIPQPYDYQGDDNYVMTTVNIPLRSFILNRPGMSLAFLDAVRFRFNLQDAAEVYVDDVEFSR